MNYRTCVYEDGTEKPFEEVKSGDLFQIKEPDTTEVLANHF